MEIFEQLRISLDRDGPGPLLVAAGHEEAFLDRRQYLETAFSQPRIFLHQKTAKQFEFKPLPIDGNYVASIFKRPRPLYAHDKNLKPYEAENYEGAVFMMSTSKDQLSWMQENKRLGSNKALLDSFFAHLCSATIRLRSASNRMRTDCRGATPMAGPFVAGKIYMRV